MSRCRACRKRGPFAAGQAFTPYVCPHCLKAVMHHTTAIPRICCECAEKVQCCDLCCQPLHPKKVCEQCNNSLLCRCVNPQWREKDES